MPRNVFIATAFILMTSGLALSQSQCNPTMTRLLHWMRVPVVLFCIGLFAAVAHAQNGVYAFEGRIIVLDPHFDYPPIEVRLVADDSNGRTIAFTYSEGTGHYAFKGLAGGTYYVVVKLDGYQEARQRVDLIGVAGFTASGINVTLKPNVPSGKPAGATSKESQQAIDAYGKALDERSKRHFDEAAKQLEIVVNLVPDYPDSHTELGEVYLELHRRVEAEREFRTASDLDPQASRPLLDLGHLYLEDAEGQIAAGAPQNIVKPMVARAHAVLSDAVIRNPKSAMAQYLLGLSDFRSEAYDNAEAELKRALALDESMIPAKIMLINILVVEKKWQTALAALDAFIAENQSSPYAQEAIGIRASVVRRLSTNP